jgi:cobalt-precorrin-5B (C1)-methyltransferase
MKPAGDAPLSPKGLRTGFTTGACAAAAAKAATRSLVRNICLEEIETTLPNGQKVTFELARWERHGDKVLCSIIKDGGDDPDCTHGAEIVAEVTLTTHSGVELRGGVGVAMVTKPGLGLDVGTPAINPVPRRNITDMVLEELAGANFPGALVTISVPDGEERAKKTLNARLGLLGGISILGTTGIVLPYSTAAFIASVVQGIGLAATHGVRELVFTTGGRSEAYAMKLLPHLHEVAFIQVGDYVGIGIKQAMRHGIPIVHIAGMMGKLSKMADGRMMTHASASEVNMDLLARLAAARGASLETVAAIKGANTARHVLEICSQAGIPDITQSVCDAALAKCSAFGKGRVAFDMALFDFGGTLLARSTEPAAVSSAALDSSPTAEPMSKQNMNEVSVHKSSGPTNAGDALASDKDLAEKNPSKKSSASGDSNP